MANNLTIDLRGEKGLLKALAELKTTGQKSAVKKAMRKAAKPIQKAAQQLAPKRTGQLRRSIKVRAMRRSRVRFGVRVVTSPGKNLFTGKTFYGAFQEFGWKTGKRGSEKRRPVEGKHFLEEAAKQTESRVTADFATFLADEIVKIAQKEAAKTKE